MCAFCRRPPASSDKEELKRIHKLMDNGNAQAFHLLAGLYFDGLMGLPQDYQKACELNLKVGELGCADGYLLLGDFYSRGNGVEVDMKKAKHYYGLAAMGGHINARFNLGVIEGHAGNVDRAVKHWKIAARAGHEDSLDAVKEGFMNAAVTKEEYANTLRAYQKSQDDMKSDERDKAAS